jgi:hypothetical protein
VQRAHAETAQCLWRARESAAAIWVGHGLGASRANGVGRAVVDPFWLGAAGSQSLTGGRLGRWRRSERSGSGSRNEPRHRSRGRSLCHIEGCRLSALTVRLVRRTAPPGRFATVRPRRRGWSTKCHVLWLCLGANVRAGRCWPEPARAGVHSQKHKSTKHIQAYAGHHAAMHASATRHMVLLRMQGLCMVQVQVHRKWRLYSPQQPTTAGCQETQSSVKHPTSATTSPTRGRPTSSATPRWALEKEQQ